MTEPVAYMWKTARGTIVGLKPNDDNHSQGTFGRIPLYTSEQLHPRVKMTQAEFDEWNELYNDFDFFSEAMAHSVSRKKHIRLFENIYLSGRNGLSGQESEREFAKLWVNFNPDNPEETIEIIPDMKWFVRSKEKENGHYQVLAQSRESVMPRYTIFKSYAMTFDTKEEAEKWTNPLTEAVQLPVEGE